MWFFSNLTLGYFYAIILPMFKVIAVLTLGALLALGAYYVGKPLVERIGRAMTGQVGPVKRTNEVWDANR